MSESLLAYYALVLARLIGFFVPIPLIGSDIMPAMTRGVIMVALTPFLVQIPVEPVQLGVNTYFIFLLIKEVALGLFLGFLISLPLRVPELIGEMIDNQRGAAVTDQYNPTMNAESSILGQFISLSVTTYFILDGGIHHLINIISQTYLVQPVGQMSFNFGESAWHVLQPVFLSYLSLFAILSLPVMLVMFIVEISLGVSSRFAQSMNVFALSQPIKSLVAVFFLISLYPHILSQIQQFFQKTTEVLNV